MQDYKLRRKHFEGTIIDVFIIYLIFICLNIIAIMFVKILQTSEVVVHIVEYALLILPLFLLGFRDYFPFCIGNKAANIFYKSSPVFIQVLKKNIILVLCGFIGLTWPGLYTVTQKVPWWLEIYSFPAALALFIFDQVFGIGLILSKVQIGGKAEAKRGQVN